MTPDLVIDASVAGGWLFGDEVSAYADAVLVAVADGGAMAPGLWPYEVANMLALAERRGRMTADEVSRAARWLEALQVRVEPAHPLRTIPGLTATAREHGLSAYDAAYLDLAVRTRSRLATLDGALRQAAARAGIDAFEA